VLDSPETSFSPSLVRGVWNFSLPNILILVSQNLVLRIKHPLETKKLVRKLLNRLLGQNDILVPTKRMWMNRHRHQRCKQCGRPTAVV
jgi:hypothetical protein